MQVLRLSQERFCNSVKNDKHLSLARLITNVMNENYSDV